MITIHIDEGSPETNVHRQVYRLSEGRFSDETLAAVRLATHGVGSFDGRDPRRLSLVYKRGHSIAPTAHAAFRVLRERYPDASFTTYSNDVKRLFGDEVKQIRFTPSRSSR